MRSTMTMPMLLAMLLPVFCQAAPEAEPSAWGGLAKGPHAVGFRLEDARDASRPSAAAVTAGARDGAADGRAVRVYLWYPARESRRPAMRLEDYVRLAADDFRSAGAAPGDTRTPPLPVPLASGFGEDARAELLARRCAAVRDADPEKAPFPVLVLGQGLYYESPLTHVVLCELLASHGYVVASCPLAGPFARLVNLSVTDLEAEVRDMEFALAVARRLPGAAPGRFGLIGYDLGGMAGLLLAMRNPEAAAFLSLDAGILSPHFSGLPAAHPHYDEDRFRIPWLHMTQARFCPQTGDPAAPPTLMDRKAYGDSYLLLADTDNHGAFTSYAALGITRAVPGYWGEIAQDPRAVHQALCAYGLAFFDAYLKGDRTGMDQLRAGGPPPDLAPAIAALRVKEGAAAPPAREGLLRRIIDEGLESALPAIQAARQAHPDSLLFREGELNWLGYHFLYWWGRQAEAVRLLALTAELFPASANAFDSLGEAYLSTGDRDRAIACYRRSLELNPDNRNAAQVLRSLDAGD